MSDELQSNFRHGALPPSQVLANDQIPTTGGVEGAQQLFRFVLRERAAILSGASAKNLRAVAAKSCTECAEVIDLDGKVNADETRIAYPSNIEAHVEVKGEHYTMRGTAQTAPAVVTFKDGNDMRAPACQLDVRMRATFRRGLWQVDKLKITSLRAYRRDIPEPPPLL